MDLAVKTFEQFRAELADAVTVAINTGTKIAPIHASYDCRCPLGVRSFHSHPPSPIAAKEWGIEPVCALMFLTGFEARDISVPEVKAARDISNDQELYLRLGMLYRRRFVETP